MKVLILLHSVAFCCISAMGGARPRCRGRTHHREHGGRRGGIGGSRDFVTFWDILGHFPMRDAPSPYLSPGGGEIVGDSRRGGRLRGGFGPRGRRGRPSEGVEQLSFGDCHVSSVVIERPCGQPSCVSAGSHALCLRRMATYLSRAFFRCLETPFLSRNAVCSRMSPVE